MISEINYLLTLNCLPVFYNIEKIFRMFIINDNTNKMTCALSAYMAQQWLRTAGASTQSDQSLRSCILFYLQH